MKKVSIIVLNYNGWKNTSECLESVKKLETGNWKLEILVVDNGSDELNQNAKIKMKNYNSKFKIIKNEENLGFAEGNNVGIRYALENGADEVMILNNDTTVDKNLVNELLKTMEKDDSFGIVGPKIYFSPGYEYHHDRYQENERGKIIWYAGGKMDWENVVGSHRGVDEVDDGQYEKCEPTDFVSGCCLMVRREVLEKVGLFGENPSADGFFAEKLCLFDPQYYLYYEDNDFCQRAKKAGFKIIYEPKAYLWHKNAGSAGGCGSHLQDYYTTRNRLLFGMKYASWKTKLALIRESLSLLISGRNYQKQGVRDFYLKKLGKGTFTNI